MNIVDAGISLFLRPRVIHSLPGRLRLHIPFLKKWGRENPDLVAMAGRLLSSPDGIKAIDPCLFTGNVLVTYDAKTVNKGDIVSFCHQVMRICVHNHDRISQAIQQHGMATVEGSLNDCLHNTLQPGLRLDGHVRIPDGFLE